MLKIASVSRLVSLSIGDIACKLVKVFIKVNFMEQRDRCDTIANNDRKHVLNKFDFEG